MLNNVFASSGQVHCNEREFISSIYKIPQKGHKREMVHLTFLDSIVPGKWPINYLPLEKSLTPHQAAKTQGTNSKGKCTTTLRYLYSHTMLGIVLVEG